MRGCPLPAAGTTPCISRIELRCLGASAVAACQEPVVLCARQKGQGPRTTTAKAPPPKPSTQSPSLRVETHRRQHPRQNLRRIACCSKGGRRRCRSPREGGGCPRRRTRSISQRNPPPRCPQDRTSLCRLSAASRRSQRACRARGEGWHKLLADGMTGSHALR